MSTATFGVTGLCALTVGMMMIIMAGGVAGQPAPAPGAADCTSVLIELVDCLPYWSGQVATPAATCCTNLSSVINSTPQCLCQLYNTTFASSIGVNVTDALQLPSACKVTTPDPRLCEFIPVPAAATSPGGSGVAPSSAPTPSDAAIAESDFPPPTYYYSDESSSPKGGVIAAAVVVSVVGFAAVLALIVCCFIKRRRKRENVGGGPPDNGTLPSSSPALSSHYIGPRSFSLQELRTATDNFSESRVLGRGGFGYVYRGNLPDGTVVAVKRIADDSCQGEKEFLAELQIIGSLRHRNLVKFKGWCFDERSYLLVYEHMANGSLDILLFDDALCARLTWKRRWAIALGLGSALQYLHEECDNIIIHRDVKASNVLLDDNFNVKLGDFGLSRQVVQGNTAHTTALAGTRGYMAPELFIGVARATRKSDIFAFGAVLLEIVTGKCVIDYGLLTNHNGMLLHWVWDMLAQGKLLDVVDQRLDGSSVVVEEAKKLLIVALACSHPEPKARPNIRQAMEALNGSATLPRVPLSRPVPSYGIMAEEFYYGTDSQSTSYQTRSSVSASNAFSGSSSDPAAAL